MSMRNIFKHLYYFSLSKEIHYYWEKRDYREKERDRMRRSFWNCGNFVPRNYTWLENRFGREEDLPTFTNNRLMFFELSNNEYGRIGQVLVTHSTIFLAVLHNITGYNSTTVKLLAPFLSLFRRHFSRGMIHSDLDTVRKRAVERYCSSCLIFDLSCSVIWFSSPKNIVLARISTNLYYS